MPRTGPTSCGKIRFITGSSVGRSRRRSPMCGMRRNGRSRREKIAYLQSSQIRTCKTSSIPRIADMIAEASAARSRATDMPPRKAATPSKAFPTLRSLSICSLKMFLIRRRLVSLGSASVPVFSLISPMRSLTARRRFAFSPAVPPGHKRF